MGGFSLAADWGCFCAGEGEADESVEEEDEEEDEAVEDEDEEAEEKDEYFMALVSS